MSHFYSVVYKCLILLTAWSRVLVEKPIFSQLVKNFLGFYGNPKIYYRLRGFVITHNDAPHSVGPLWTSDQLVAETST
jgi:hypothetical protein